MPVRIKLTDTNAERADVYQFRYQVYVEEMGRLQKHADHASKRIKEPLDETGHLLVAYDKSNVVGTARFNVGVDENFGVYEELYKLRQFGPFYPTSVSITTKLMVAPGYRRSTLPLQLAVQCFKGGLELGTRFDVIDCNPPLVDFFRRLGYRQVFPSIEHPEYGNVVPMVLALYDSDHLRLCGSPFAKMASHLTDESQSVNFFYSVLSKHADAIEI
jgi:predicted GNAT family N-acyltransferase